MVTNDLSTTGKYVKLKDINNLIMIVAGSPTAFIQHFVFKEKHVYFVNVIFHTGGSLVYYVILDKKLNNKYITFNKVNGKIDFQDDFKLDVNLAFIPIIEIEEQNILPSELLT